MRRQVRYVKTGQLDAFFIFAWFPISIPAALIIRLLSPFFLIRISDFQSHSMGMMVERFCPYLCKEHPNCIDIFFIGKISNVQFVKMAERLHENIYKNPYYFLKSLEWLNLFFFRNNKFCVYPFSAQSIVNGKLLLDFFPTQFQFTFEEELFGLDQLRQMGIPENAKIVCLIVRDDAYFNELKRGYDDCKNSYRNSSVKNFNLVCEYLISQGYYVVRMGAKVNQPLPIKHPQVIDYAYEGFRTDFMDIYLGKQCSFCISTDTGWDTVPSHMFRKPMVYVNFSQLGLAHTFSNRFLFLAKKFVFKQDNSELKLREIFDNGFTELRCSTQLERANIMLVENSAEEIRDAVSEMVDRLEGHWKTTRQDERLQKRFWEIFPTKALSVLDGTRIHGEIRARYSANYLRNNPDWLT